MTPIDSEEETLCRMINEYSQEGIRIEGDPEMMQILRESIAEANAEHALTIEQIQADCAVHGVTLDNTQATVVDCVIVHRVLTARKQIEDIVRARIELSPSHGDELKALLEDIQRQ